MEEKKLTPREILERGLVVFRKITSQPIPLVREEMMDLLNFEVIVTSFISNMKAAEGKSPEELVEIARQAVMPQD